MDRRSFLRLIGAAAPVALAKPTYFFAPVGGWKSDVIVNPNDQADIDVWRFYTYPGYPPLFDRFGSPRYFTYGFKG